MRKSGGFSCDSPPRIRRWEDMTPHAYAVSLVVLTIFALVIIGIIVLPDRTSRRNWRKGR